MLVTTLPAAKGTYSPVKGTQRPIRLIVIHATELSFDATVRRFTTNNAVSAHYLIRQSDGEVTQFVPDEAIAWHAGNWDVNAMSIGIELEADTQQSETFTPVMLATLVNLIEELADKYGIPVDRGHIIGHDNVPSTDATMQAKMHTDPGLHFPWQELFKTLGVSTPTLATPITGDVVTTLQNAVALFSKPDATAPLKAAANSGLVPELSFGQVFVCGARQMNWIGIWYDGELAWCPLTKQTGALQGVDNQVVARSDISVYGTLKGEAPIGRLPAGSRYVILDYLRVKRFVDRGGLAEASGFEVAVTVIWYNHRLGFLLE